MMVNKKDLIMAVLITFCLISTLFTIMAGSSQGPVSTASLSLNSPDGGELTTNVNVTNWQPKYRIDQYTLNLSWWDWGKSYGYDAPASFAPGYSRMSIQLIIDEWWHTKPIAPNVTTVWISDIIWEIGKQAGGYNLCGKPIPTEKTANITIYSWMSETQVSDISNTLEVDAQYYSILFGVKPGCKQGWLLMDVYVYLSND
jgi:hypothetical protein